MPLATGTAWRSTPLGGATGYGTIQGNQFGIPQVKTPTYNQPTLNQPSGGYSYNTPNYLSLAAAQQQVKNQQDATLLRYQQAAFGGMGTSTGWHGEMSGGIKGNIPAYYTGFLGEGPVNVGGRFSPTNTPQMMAERTAALLGVPYGDLPATLYRIQNLGPAQGKYASGQFYGKNVFDWSDITSVENFGKYPIWGTTAPTSWTMAAVGEQLRMQQEALNKYSAAPGIGLQMGQPGGGWFNTNTGQWQPTGSAPVGVSTSTPVPGNSYSGGGGAFSGGAKSWTPAPPAATPTPRTTSEIGTRGDYSSSRPFFPSIDYESLPGGRRRYSGA